MGPFFVNPPLFNIEEGYKSSTKETPIIFIITPGSDPMADLRAFTEKKTSQELKQISLGQGQGPVAESLFKRCSDSGEWLFFQNTHLYISWMPNLEKMIEQLKSSDTNEDFRLFLTTASVPDFPVSILQEGIKLTVESTGDVKQMMLNS
jgi:dynein heavy chain